MSEHCKTCRKAVRFGIWMSSQFRDEKVLLFCSDTCKQEYIKMRLNRIKANYPRYYEKLITWPQREEGFYDFDLKGRDRRAENKKNEK